ncbi:MAG: molybdenum cofactor guanylyltransferase MobA [Rhodospirillaceae bacterium]|jgi:molybdopterin-guanine dinucleotide biosynthesis protein A|nr:molybdenum cofactor guanylyltransferase MobA [Rhodospirillaceae bacterium]MBT5457655.1 molybdenum cofactor guanylyltransferase MobA [Rhodospirillaceae bacterium]
MPDETGICGLLLAGGQSRRMGGGDKCLQELGGQTLLARILEIARPQVGPLVLNANGDAARFADYDLPVAPDVVDGFAGPLAGVLTGLEWARHNAPDCQWVASFACDAPFAPADLVPRLMGAIEAGKADMACASSAGRDQPVFGLWPVRLAGDLRDALVDEDIRKVDVWTARYRLARHDWACDPVDPFFNVNRPGDLEAAEGLLGTMARNSGS